MAALLGCAGVQAETARKTNRSLEYCLIDWTKLHISDGRPAGLRSKAVRRRRDGSDHDLPAPTREATPKG